MFERLNSPEKIFSYKLGAALTMEKDTLEMLSDLEEAAQRPELKQLLHEHAAETRVQIGVLEQCFGLLGEKVDDSPCPVTKALAAEAKATLKKTDDSLVDAVILAGALETEHHEQAVYETLVIHARARGAEQVAVLLETSLGMEQSAGAKVKALAQRIATTGVATPTEGMSTGAKAGLAAGVAATIGAAAAAVSKVAENKAEGQVREAATASLETHPPTTGTSTATSTATGTTATTTGGTTPGAEVLNDHALQERIAETEGREVPHTTGS